MNTIFLNIHTPRNTKDLLIFHTIKLYNHFTIHFRDSYHDICHLKGIFLLTAYLVPYPGHVIRSTVIRMKSFPQNPFHVMRYKDDGLISSVDLPYVTHLPWKLNLDNITFFNLLIEDLRPFPRQILTGINLWHPRSLPCKETKRDN